MLDSNTDRSYFMIGAVIVGAAIIAGALFIFGDFLFGDVVIENGEVTSGYVKHLIQGMFGDAADATKEIGAGGAGAGGK